MVEIAEETAKECASPDINLPVDQDLSSLASMVSDAQDIFDIGPISQPKDVVARATEVLGNESKSNKWKAISCGRLSAVLEQKYYFDEAIEVVKLLLLYLNSQDLENENHDFLEKARFLTQGRLFKLRRLKDQKSPDEEEVSFYRDAANSENPSIKPLATITLSNLYEKLGKFEGSLSAACRYLDLLPSSDVARRLGVRHRIFKLMDEVNMEIDIDDYESLYFEILSFPEASKDLRITAFKQLGHFTRALEAAKDYHRALDVSTRVLELQIAFGQPKIYIELSEQKIARLRIILISKEIRDSISANRFREALTGAEEIALLQTQVHTPDDMIARSQSQLHWLRDVVATLPEETQVSPSVENFQDDDEEEEETLPEEPQKTLVEDYVDWLLTVKKEVEEWLSATGRDDDPNFVITIKKKKRGRHIGLLDSILERHGIDDLSDLFEEFEDRSGDKRVENMTRNLERSLRQDKINLHLVTDILEQINL